MCDTKNDCANRVGMGLFKEKKIIWGVLNVYRGYWSADGWVLATTKVESFSLSSLNTNYSFFW